MEDAPDSMGELIMADAVSEWRKKGFTETHLWPGEYTLLIHPQTRLQVRIYLSGQVWMSDPKTGKYIQEAKNEV